MRAATIECFLQFIFFFSFRFASLFVPACSRIPQFAGRRHSGSFEDELANFSLADGVQEVLNVVGLSIGQLRVERQPSFEVLFGTEEVVDSSTTTQENS
jgi:hypothetical protein